MIFQGIRTSIAKKAFSFGIFQGVGVQTPCPPIWRCLTSQSTSRHVETYSWAVEVLSGEDKVSCPMTQHSISIEDKHLLHKTLCGIRCLTSQSTICKSKEEGKDQKSIQSSTTPDPGYQWESDNVTIRDHK